VDGVAAIDACEPACSPLPEDFGAYLEVLGPALALLGARRLVEAGADLSTRGVVVEVACIDEPRPAGTSTLLTVLDVAEDAA